MKKALKYFLYVCFSPTGRINRAWWLLYILLVNFCHWGTIWIIIDNSGGYAPDAVFFFDVVFGVVIVYPTIVVTIKRFRDTNRSGYNLFWGFIPAFGVLYILIVCGFFKGTEGENKYGEPSSLIDWDSFNNDTNTQEKEK